jgi:hypothetical protein
VTDYHLKEIYFFKTVVTPRIFFVFKIKFLFRRILRKEYRRAVGTHFPSDYGPAGLLEQGQRRRTGIRRSRRTVLLDY